MATYNEVKPKRVFMCKLNHDSDLLGQLNELACNNNIRLGKVEAIGAVKKARIGFYNQQTFTYEFIDMDKPLEITSLTGNISLKDGKPFIHAHITLGDDTGKVIGGHLAEGTVVFACEFVITELIGTEYKRAFDEQTHLPLWDI